METQHPRPGSTRQPETQRVMDAAPNRDAMGQVYPRRRASLLRSPQAAGAPRPCLRGRCGGASWPGHGWENTTGGELTLNLATRPQSSAAWGFLPGARGEGVLGRKEILVGLWVICNLLPQEELSLNPARHLARACLPHGFRGS